MNALEAGDPSVVRSMARSIFLQRDSPAGVLMLRAGKLTRPAASVTAFVAPVTYTSLKSEPHSCTTTQPESGFPASSTTVISHGGQTMRSAARAEMAAEARKARKARPARNNDFIILLNSELLRPDLSASIAHPL